MSSVVSCPMLTVPSRWVADKPSMCESVSAAYHGGIGRVGEVEGVLPLVGVSPGTLHPATDCPPPPPPPFREMAMVICDYTCYDFLFKRVVFIP